MALSPSPLLLCFASIVFIGAHVLPVRLRSCDVLVAFFGASVLSDSPLIMGMTIKGLFPFKHSYS
jgi:hypothetical protein